MDVDKITHIIFDLNRTIFDWDRAQAIAYEAVNKLLPSDIIDAFWCAYMKIQNELFHQYLENSITFDQYKKIRFYETLKSLGIDDFEFSQRITQSFSAHGLGSRVFCEGALELLDFLKKIEKPLILLTNGPKETQRQIIETLNLKQYFDAIYISGETGFPKPTIDAYFQVLQNYKIKPEHCLMIGEDWDNDIEMARKLGMQTYWAKSTTKQNSNQTSKSLYGEQGSLVKLLEIFKNSLDVVV